MPKKRYMVNPDILTHDETEEILLVNPDNAASVVTNAVGREIWLALKQPCTPEEIVAHLIEVCEDAPADQVATDVEEFLQKLLSGGFIGEVLDEVN